MLNIKSFPFPKIELYIQININAELHELEVERFLQDNVLKIFVIRELNKYICKCIQLCLSLSSFHTQSL